MTTIFDTATPKQIEKFVKFKQELLDWKNCHARVYASFVKHMNSDKPEAMVGLGQMLAVLCPQISFAVVDCWNDDTLSSRDWLKQISSEVSIASVMDAYHESVEPMKIDTMSDNPIQEANDFIKTELSFRRRIRDAKPFLKLGIFRPYPPDFGK